MNDEARLDPCLSQLMVAGARSAHGVLERQIDALERSPRARFPSLRLALPGSMDGSILKLAHVTTVNRA